MYRRYWRPIFIGTVGLIAIVLVVGRAARGSTRWINVGFFTFQPSEFGKLLFVLAIAGFITERARGATDVRTTLRTLGLGAIPVVLVFAQPDLGTALVYTAALGAMLFICGTPWRQLAVLGSLGVLAVVVVLWAGPAVGRQLPQAVPEVAAHLLRASAEVHGRRALQPRAVDRGRRLRPVPRPRAEERDADAAQLPAGARHRLRVRVVQRAARLRRRVASARPLPARSLAGPAHRHGRARPVLGDRRRRDRRCAALPDLRERRHDDGDRADHRYPIAVRERRRLVDDREPRRDGRAARDPRARTRVARSSRRR